jgi:putative phage-type endonuclease
MNCNVIQYEDWKQQRTKGIGGSDVAAILGVSPYKTPLRVYLEKKGEIDNTEDNEAMYWGRVLEDVVAKEFEKRTGYKIQEAQYIVQHKELPCLIGNLDRLIVDDQNVPIGVLECKTASSYTSARWNDGEVPEEYLLQLMHYLNITQLQFGYLAVLIGGNIYKTIKIEKNDELIQVMMDKCKHFWEEFIEKDIAPAVTAEDNELMKVLYPQAIEGEAVYLNDEIDTKIEEIQSIKEQTKELQKKLDELEAIVKNEMKTAEIAETSRYRVSWKNSTQTRLDTKLLKEKEPDTFKAFVKETNSRILRIKEML